MALFCTGYCSGECSVQTKQLTAGHTKRPMQVIELSGGRAQASGPAFARRRGAVTRIAHPAQQPLSELPNPGLPQRFGRAGLPAQSAAQPADSSAAAAAVHRPQPLGASAPWQEMQRQQQQSWPAGQSGSGLFRHPAGPPSNSTAESAFDQSLQSCAALEPAKAAARDCCILRSASASRQGESAEGHAKPAAEAASSHSEGGSRGRIRAWTDQGASAAVDTLAKALLSLRQNSSAKAAASSVRTTAVVASGRKEAVAAESGTPAAASPQCPPALSGASRCAKGCKEQPAEVAAHRFGARLSGNRDSRIADTTDGNMGAKPEACQPTQAQHVNPLETGQKLSWEEATEAAELDACVRPSAGEAGDMQQAARREIIEGVFHGMRVILDSGLDKAEAERCAYLTLRSIGRKRA